MNVNEFIGILFQVAVTMIMAGIAKFVVPALKAYASSKQYSEVYMLVETAVKAAEQTIKGSGTGAAKKEQVVSLVSDWLTKRGITITEEQLDRMIEECVYMLSHS